MSKYLIKFTPQFEKRVDKPTTIGQNGIELRNSRKCFLWILVFFATLSAGIRRSRLRMVRWPEWFVDSFETQR